MQAAQKWLRHLFPKAIFDFFLFVLMHGEFVYKMPGTSFKLRERRESAENSDVLKSNYLIQLLIWNIAFSGDVLCFYLFQFALLFLLATIPLTVYKFVMYSTVFLN